MADAVLGIRRHEGLDVILEGVGVQALVRSKKGLLSHGVRRVELPRYLPCQAVERLQQLALVSILADLRPDVQVGDVQNFGIGRHLVRRCRVMAENHVVGVQCLRNADRRCARRLQVRRQPQMIEGIEPIAAADGQKSRRVQAPVQNVRKRLADPVQVGGPTPVLEGKHQQ